MVQTYRKLIVYYFLQNVTPCYVFFRHRAKCGLILHLHSPALGKSVVWGGEEKGSRQRNETKCSCGHSCGLSSAPGETGTALGKALTTMKPAGIAEKDAQEEQCCDEEPVSHVERTHHKLQSQPCSGGRLWRVLSAGEHQITGDLTWHFLQPHSTDVQRYLFLQGQVEEFFFLGAVHRQWKGLAIPIMGSGESCPPLHGYLPAPEACVLQPRYALLTWCFSWCRKQIIHT